MWGFLVLFFLLFCLKIFCNKKKKSDLISYCQKVRKGSTKQQKTKQNTHGYGEQANWKSTQRPKLEQVEQKEYK